MPNAQDLAFVQLATASGLAEVSEGQIAVAKSFNPAVRNFGQQMVTGHMTRLSGTRYARLEPGTSVG